MRAQLAVVLAALALTACKDYPADSKPSQGGKCSAPVEKADAVRRYLEADCGWMERCGFIPAGEIDACLEIQAGMGFERMLAERLNDPRLAYDAGAMACCIEELASFPCVDEPEPPSCSRAGRGIVPLGGACEEHFHCDGGQCDDGTCVARPGPGEPCYELCIEGNACSWDEEYEGDTGMCVPLAAEGESCIPYDRPCVPGLACDFDWRGTDGAGVCRPPAREGEHCSRDRHCASAELYCAFDEGDLYSSGTCTRRVGAGEPCSDLRAESFGGCIVGLVCDAPSYGAPGTCVVPPGEGESCAELQECAFPLTCLRDDTCGRALFHGEPCGDREDLCVFGQCIDGLCDWYGYE